MSGLRHPLSGRSMVGAHDAGQTVHHRPGSIAATLRVVVLSTALGFGAASAIEVAEIARAAMPAAGQGAFAFHYAYRLSESDLRWLAKFRVVVLARALPAPDVQRLQRAGVTLFLYEWLTGFYRDRHSGPWENLLVSSKPFWVLNPRGPVAGPDNTGRAYYYDPAAPDLANAWALELSRRLDHGSAAGIFFDLVGRPSVPERLLQGYAERHPGTPFDAATAGQIRALRTARPSTLIFTNQGYRLPEFYLPLADYDLSESLMTSTEGGQAVEVFVDGRGLVRTHETFYRSWDALRPIIASIDAAATRHNPRVRLLHLNYVAPRFQPTGQTRLVKGGTHLVVRETTDRPAIYYAFAAAKLWGHDSFSALEGVLSARDDVYFADLGNPLGQTWEERDGLLVRYYRKGAVVVNPSGDSRGARLESPLLPRDVRDLWDCYAGVPVGGLTITVEPTVSVVSRVRYPAGRVYLHLR